MNALCIVPCGKKKIWSKLPRAGARPARDVYIGTFAVKCREYAERFYPLSWCILSAKYGFLFPDDVIAGPYNVTFNDESTKPITVAELLIQANNKNLHRFNTIVVLGGKKYVQLAKSVFSGKEIYTPLGGCRGIGFMMRRINGALRRGTPIEPGDE